MRLGELSPTWGRTVGNGTDWGLGVGFTAAAEGEGEGTADGR